MLQFVSIVRKKENHRITILILLTIGLWGCHGLLSKFSEDLLKNRGFSFGWCDGMGWLALPLYGVVFWKVRKKLSVGLILILAGGGANLVDRMSYGYVRDYWSLGIINVYNNINDWFIVMGTVIFIYNLWKRKSK